MEFNSSALRVHCYPQSVNAVVFKIEIARHRMEREMAALRAGGDLRELVALRVAPSSMIVMRWIESPASVPEAPGMFFVGERGGAEWWRRNYFPRRLGKTRRSDW